MGNRKLLLKQIGNSQKKKYKWPIIYGKWLNFTIVKNTNRAMPIFTYKIGDILKK